MNTRELGRTGIEISPLGLGCWQFSEGKGLVGGFWPALPPDVVQGIVHTSLAGGITWFDTAEAYGGGKSEAALARALKAEGKAPGSVVVATKWMPFGRTAGNIGKTIGDRLRYLDGYPIDLYQVHQAMGALATHAAEMDAMADLVEAAKVKSVGISNFNASQMRTCHEALAKRGLPLASNQMKYSLLDRRIEGNGVMDAAKELGVTIIAYSPLAQGLLSGKFHDDPSLIKNRPGPRKWMPAFRDSGLERSKPVVEVVRRIAERHGVTPSQVALNWLVTFHGDTVVAIPGASKVKHAEENVGALSFQLSDAELAEIDEVSRPFIEKAGG